MLRAMYAVRSRPGAEDAAGRGGRSSPQQAGVTAAGRGRPRILAIDVARGLSIALVVLGHTPVPQWLNGPLSVVRLPLFFVVSGFLFNLARYRDAGRMLVARRVQRLVVPYLVSGLLTYLFWLCVKRRVEPAQGRIPWYRPLLGLLYGSSTEEWLPFNLPLWFLPTLFSASLVFWALMRAVANRSRLVQAAAFALAGATGAVAGRLVFLPWGLDIALVAQPFLWTGSLLRQAGWLARQPFLPALAWLGGAALYVLSLTFNGPVAMNVREYGSLPWFYAGGVGGSLVLLRLAQGLAARPAAYRLLAALGRNSLVILSFHVGLAFPLLAQMAQALLGDPYLHAWWLYWLWGLAFPAALAAGINRHPLLRLLLAGDPT
ncbi:MAG: hypothetical protein DIU69_11175, partial [Bacillota bacterium]